LCVFSALEDGTTSQDDSVAYKLMNVSDLANNTVDESIDSVSVTKETLNQGG